jgi:hypothetical protein
MATDGSRLEREAERQQALVRALADPGLDARTVGLAEQGDQAARGLDAYRTNAAAIAERALAAAFPTLVPLVGAADFGRLARRFRAEHPPTAGDLGEWGADFAAWLEAQPLLAEWPYLGDGARLDWAVHGCERAPDARFDAASLSWLERADPAELRIELAPGTTVLVSRWPVATILAAHRDRAPADLDTARAALAAGRGERVLVVREGWRAIVETLDPPTCAWTRSLLDGADLSAALGAAGEGFDVAGWLATALAGRRLQRVVRRAEG